MVLNKHYFFRRMLLAFVCALLVLGKSTQKAYAESQLTIQSIEITYLAKDTFLIEEPLDLSGTKLTVTYEDGTTEMLEITDGDNVYDSYGKCLLCEASYLYNEEGEYEDIGGTGLYNAGTYELYFRYYDVVNDCYESIGDSIETGIEIKVLDYHVSDLEDVTSLTLGEVYSASLESSVDMAWFSFTPSHTALYIFKSMNNSDEEGFCVELYSTLYQADEDGKLTELDWDESGIDFNFYQKYYLEEGITYYYRAKTWNIIDVYDGTFDVQILEGKDIQSFSVEELSQTEFVQGIDDLDLTGTVITITYTDGTVGEAIIDGENAVDRYDNTIDYCIFLQETYDSYHYLQPLILAAGVYSIHFACYDSEIEYDDNMGTVEITPIENSDKVCEITNLNEEFRTEGKSSEYVWYSYIPDETGNYYMNVRQDEENWEWYNLEIFYVTENGECITVEKIYYDVEVCNDIYRLKEGETYYIGASCSGEPDAQIVTTLMEVKRLESSSTSETTVEENEETSETDVTETPEMTENGEEKNTSETGIILRVIVGILLLGAAAVIVALAKKRANA